jgi:hypothetical protein
VDNFLSQQFAELGGVIPVPVWIAPYNSFEACS